MVGPSSWPFLVHGLGSGFVTGWLDSTPKRSRIPEDQCQEAAQPQVGRERKKKNQHHGFLGSRPRSSWITVCTGCKSATPKEPRQIDSFFLPRSNRNVELASPQVGRRRWWNWHGAIFPLRKRRSAQTSSTTRTTLWRPKP